jgi:hypothetical protein
MFNIASIVSRVGAKSTGHSLILVDVIKTLNDRGDAEYAETEHDIDGVVQIVSAQEDEVKEGILMPLDLICFFDDVEINLPKLKNGNKLKYDGKMYKIIQVISEIGHTEVLAKRL